MAAHAAPVETFAVRVVVRSNAQPIEAYVAFVPPDRPGSRPAAEAVLPHGVTSVRVPAGLYAVTVFARGYQDAGRTVRVTRTTEVTFDVAPSVWVGGVVRDSAGAPVAGASVRNLRLVGPSMLAPVSERARQVFRADWETITDAKGKWRLPGSPDTGIPVLIEAPGFAPAHLFCGATDPCATTLQAGATLRVTFDHTDPDLFVTLRRKLSEPAQVAAGWEPFAWARAASTPSVAWESLPPGTYELVARYLDPKRFTPSTVLGSITLRPHQAGELKAVLPRAVPPADATVVFVPGRPPGSLMDLVAMVSAKHGAEPVDDAVEASSGGTLLYLRTAADPAALYLYTAESILATGGSGEGTADSPRPTILMDRGDMSVQLRREPEGPPLPPWVTAQFSDCGTGQRLTLAVAPSQEGALRIPAPVACKALVLRAPPFAPVIVHPSLAARERRTFGPYDLTLAGSASIHVVHDPGGTPVPRAIVRAIEENVVLAEGEADSEGKLVLTGLPIREQVVEGRDPVTDLSGSVRLTPTAGEPATVESLPVPEPARLVIALRLASDFLQRFPEAVIHSVTIEHAAEQYTERVQEGEAVFAHVRPGSWEVLVLIEAGGSLQPVPLEGVTLTSAEQRRVEATLAPPVFEGHVIAGNTGVAAQVAFGDPPGPGAVIRFARTDGRGRYIVMLPRTGLYHVTVTRIDTRTSIDVGEIPFTDPTRPVDILLPDGALAVSVRDRDGQVANADVTAVLRRASSYGDLGSVSRSARTDVTGTAVFEGLLEGRWLIQAVAPAGGHAEASVPVGDGPASLELEVQPGATMSGIVHSGTPVAGANVTCLFVGSGGLPNIGRAETGADGRFTIDLPGTPATLHCGVATSAGQIGAYVTTPTSSADFLLPATTGALHVPDWGSSAGRDKYWLVTRDGRFYGLSWAAEKWGVAQTALMIPRIAAGAWKIVSVTTPDEWLRLATGGANALPVVAEFRIERGQASTVRLH